MLFSIQQSTATKTHNYKWTLGGLLLGITLFRLWYIVQIPISGDEAYHWEWSRHLALGYYDHPPLTAYFIYLFTLIGGSSLFFTRLSAVLFSLLSAVIVFMLGREVFGSERVGFWSSLLVVIVPIFAVGAILITTDAPHGFFWILSIYLFYRAIFGCSPKWWYLAGVSLGLALLSKLLASLIIVSIGLFLICSPAQRHWLKKREPYLALVIALLVFSPFLFWNATHNWATFAFNLQARHQIPQLRLKFLGEYLGGQLLGISPFLFLAYIYIMGYIGWRGFKAGESKLLFLFFSSVTIWLVFLAFSLVNRVGLHWPAAGYFSGMVALVGWADARLGDWSSKKRWLAGIIGIFLIVQTGLLHALALYPEIIPSNITYRGRPKKINTAKLNEFYGWKELAQRVEQTHQEMSAGNKTFIFTQSYAFSSLIAFNSPQKSEVLVLGKKGVHGLAFSDWQDLPSLAGYDALLVCKEKRDEKKIIALFDEIMADPPLKIYRGSQLIRTFKLYRCYNFKPQMVIEKKPQ